MSFYAMLYYLRESAKRDFGKSGLWETSGEEEATRSLARRWPSKWAQGGPKSAFCLLFVFCFLWSRCWVARLVGWFFVCSPACLPACPFVCLFPGSLSALRHCAETLGNYVSLCTHACTHACMHARTYAHVCTYVRT